MGKMYQIDDNTKLYVGYDFIRRSRNNTTTFQLHADTTHTELPNDATPAEPYIAGKYIKIKKIGRMAIQQLPTIQTTWEQYINNLEEWDKVLVQENIDIDQNKLIQAMREKKEILICSDGGAKENIGSYGVTIANDNTVLIAIMGRAYGYRPRSFRAEAYGMLAALRYIYHCCVYFKIKYDSDTYIYCNNKGLLLRIETHDDKQKPSPRQLLYSEIDVEMLIIDTSKTII